MKKVSERMLELREGMTQADAGKRIGKTQQVWARYESGAVKPNAEMILQICSSFHVSADWLLGLTDERVPVVGTASNALQQKIHDLEVEVEALQKALAIVGGRPARPVKTGGAPVAKIA